MKGAVVTIFSAVLGAGATPSSQDVVNLPDHALCTLRLACCVSDEVLDAAFLKASDGDWGAAADMLTLRDSAAHEPVRWLHLHSSVGATVALQPGCGVMVVGNLSEAQADLIRDEALAQGRLLPFVAQLCVVDRAPHGTGVPQLLWADSVDTDFVDPLLDPRKRPYSITTEPPAITVPARVSWFECSDGNRMPDECKQAAAAVAAVAHEMRTSYRYESTRFLFVCADDAVAVDEGVDCKLPEGHCYVLVSWDADLHDAMRSMILRALAAFHGDAHETSQRSGTFQATWPGELSDEDSQQLIAALDALD